MKSRWGWPEWGVGSALVVSGAVWLAGITWGEVYPAPNLPSFGGVIESGSEAPLSWSVTLIDSTGARSTIDQRQLFEDAPDSQWQNLLTGVVDGTDDPDVQRWFVEQAERTMVRSTCSTRVILERHGRDVGRWTFDGTCG